jgi:UDP-3-O-[3-hydroxymyristoyl] glucosamine N-acyltransferase
MTDERFFPSSGPLRLTDIASHVAAELSDLRAGEMMVHGVGSLDTAKSGELSQFSDARYRSAFAKSHASVVVTSRELSGLVPFKGPLLVVALPRVAYARICDLFFPPALLLEGTHSTAQIDVTALLGEGCQIDAGVVVGPEARIGSRCHLSSNVVIGAGVVLGDDCDIGANSAIGHALIGSHVRIASNVSIGGSGFGFTPGPHGPVRMPHLGRVIIEDNVEIGGNCAIDRGADGDTVLGAGSVLDNLIQIAHNVRLGRNCVIAGQAGIAGSTVLGDYVMVGGQAAINDHLTIGTGARVAGKSGVMRDVGAGETVGGYPAVPVRQWHRQTIGLMRLAARRINGHT